MYTHTYKHTHRGGEKGRERDLDSEMSRYLEDDMKRSQDTLYEE